MWHSGRKSQRKQSAILLASTRSFFFLAAAIARSINLCRMRMEMIVDPAGEDRCLHRNRPGLRQSPHPDVQLAARCPKLSFLVNSTTRILDAVADRLLVNI